jgi:hypothetical protein
MQYLEHHLSDIHFKTALYNYFSSRLEAFDVEMGNSSSELIDYFLKRSQRAARKV